MLEEKIIRKVSVVIPVYNEEESLPELVRRTDVACAVLNLDYEILLVDDGSSDRSGEMIADAADMPGSHVVGVLLNRNYGQHSAIMAGFSHVSGDLIITLDADLQNPPKRSQIWCKPLSRGMTWSVPCVKIVRTVGSAAVLHAPLTS